MPASPARAEPGSGHGLHGASSSLHGAGPVPRFPRVGVLMGPVCRRPHSASSEGPNGDRRNARGGAHERGRERGLRGAEGRVVAYHRRRLFLVAASISMSMHPPICHLYPGLLESRPVHGADRHGAPHASQHATHSRRRLDSAMSVSLPSVDILEPASGKHAASAPLADMLSPPPTLGHESPPLPQHVLASWAYPSLVRATDLLQRSRIV